MKALSLSLLSITVFMSFSFAQQKAVQKVVIQTPTVQCEMCKDKIEKYLSREPGVSAVKVDYKKKTTTVTYIADRNNIEQIKTAIVTLAMMLTTLPLIKTRIRNYPSVVKSL
jgi:mercuric ion binding protein